MLEHVPVLQIIIPMLAAPLCMLMPRGTAAWAVATLATGAAFSIALHLINLTSGGAVIFYAMGDWLPPYGIEYRIDRLAAYMFGIITTVSLITVFYARTSISQQVAEHKEPAFYAVYLLCLSGLLGIVATNDAFNLYVFLEISSLATYTLIAMGRDRRALDAAFQYLIIGTIGATFILIGIGLLYMMTGTLNMSDLAERIPELENSRPILAAFAFITVGVSMKAALFPLHMWLPNAYAHAPHFISAFVAATATKTGIYILLRMFYTVFGYQFAFNTMPVGGMLLGLAVLGILIASTVAVFQTNLKRMLAFSSIAHIGYIVLGIGLASREGLSAAILILANHAVAKGALFMAVGCMGYQLARVGIYRVNRESVAGLAKAMPYTSMAFVMAGLALVGVPLSAGFLSKWYLISATLDKGYWPLAVVLVIASLLAMLYIWRQVDALYFQPANARVAEMREAPASLLIPTWVLVALCWWVGMQPNYTVTLADEAATQLMNISPEAGEFRP